MKVLDSGHRYALKHLDGEGEEILTFVKREGSGYPGNEGHYQGTNIQEVLRALIDRVHYLDGQIHHHRNIFVLRNLREALWSLEHRAAERHKRTLTGNSDDIDTRPVCPSCGHVDCSGQCGH